MAQDLNMTIVYSGTDRGYFDNLQNRFVHMFEQINFSFHIIYEPSKDSYQKSFLKMKSLGASIYFIDLTHNTESQALIIQYLKRLNNFKGRTIVALVDDKSKLSMAWECQADLYFVKSNEFFDVVNHPMALISPEKAKPNQFATAKFQKEFSMLEDFKLGYFGPDYIHVESNLNINDDEIIELNSNIDKNLIQTKKYKMRKRESKNLYYDFKYSYDFELLYQDPLTPNEEDKEKCNELEDAMEKEQCLLDLDKKLEALAVEHAENQKILIRKYGRWLDDNISSSFSKKTKILIADNVMEFLKDTKSPLDSFPFTIRLHSHISKDASEIDRILPNIIVFNFNELPSKEEEEVDEVEEEMVGGEDEKEKQNEADLILSQQSGTQIEQLERIVAKVKSYDDFTPFIIVFNCHSYTTKALQDSFKYPLLMVNKEDVSLDLVIKMADLYENKQQEKFDKLAKEKILALRKENPQKYGKLTVESLQEKRYFVKKSNQLSKVSYEHKIILKSLSESHLTFLSDVELPLSNYRFEVPNEFSFRIVPVDGKEYQKEKGKFLYKGLIHGTGIKSKMQLRQLVNAVMQIKETEMAEKELADFIALNEKVKADIEEELSQTEES